MGTVASKQSGKSWCLVLIVTKLAMKLLVLSAIFSLAIAQETHHCPDAWIVNEYGAVMTCILPAEDHEKVTKGDAELICEGHDGWLVEVDENTSEGKNHWLRHLLEDLVEHEEGWHGHNYDDQWWIGATVQGEHGDHNWGNWVWDHSNTSVDWYDWLEGEPNDWHGQNCLTYLFEHHEHGWGSYGWNDWDCHQVARYICEKPVHTI